MTQTNLLPCPCCGSDAQLLETSRGFTAACTECDVGLVSCNWTEKAAASIWNTRHTPKRIFAVNPEPARGEKEKLQVSTELLSGVYNDSSYMLPKQDITINNLTGKSLNVSSKVVDGKVVFDIKLSDD